MVIVLVVVAVLGLVLVVVSVVAAVLGLVSVVVSMSVSLATTADLGLSSSGTFRRDGLRDGLGDLSSSALNVPWVGVRGVGCWLHVSVSFGRPARQDVVARTDSPSGGQQTGPCSSERYERGRALPAHRPPQRARRPRLLSAATGGSEALVSRLASIVAPVCEPRETRVPGHLARPPGSPPRLNGSASLG